jgi:outer membrane lipoprotein SlyB
MIPIIAATGGGKILRILLAATAGAVVGKKISDAQHKKELEEIRDKVDEIERRMNKKN